MIGDLVYLAFREGEARERALFDLVKQFSKMAPEDLEWLRYKLSVVECRALENVARLLNDAAAEQARLHESIAGEAISQVLHGGDATAVRLCHQCDYQRHPDTGAHTFSGSRGGDWVKKALEQYIRDAQNALASATADFRVKLGRVGPVTLGVLWLWSDCWMDSAGWRGLAGPELVDNRSYI